MLTTQTRVGCCIWHLNVNICYKWYLHSGVNINIKNEIKTPFLSIWKVNMLELAKKSLQTPWPVMTDANCELRKKTSILSVTVYGFDFELHECKS